MRPTGFKSFHLFLALGILLLSSLFCVLSKAEEPLSFREALKKYHRHGEYFSAQSMHANIVWDAVYRSEEFREAQAKKYAQWYHLTDAELQSRLWEEREEARRGAQFIVVLYTYSPKWNDLDAQDSIWRLRLEMGSESYEPVSISKMKPSPLDLTYYPYGAPWSKMYSVWFAPEILASGVRDFRLTLYGAKGQQTLHFQ